MLKGGNLSQDLLTACLYQALAMIRDQAKRFDFDGKDAAGRIVNTGRYQCLGGFAGVLVEVNVEHGDCSTSMTMLVKPVDHFPMGEWKNVVFDDGKWRLENEEPCWN